ncbi:hypothetical protein FB451DRAFT_1562405 [Mycena latifolia]|nr:hypothetical protein FB451DRAFT_1562405 [Mycena latifolia]
MPTAAREMSCYCSWLPYEILLTVFRHALPPSWLLSDTTASLPPFAHSPLSVDLRMKVAIITVRHTWHQVGIQLLYEHVTLRRFNQIPAFLWTLESREGLGALVRSLDVNCLVPPRFLISLDCHTTQIFQLSPPHALRLLPTGRSVAPSCQIQTLRLFSMLSTSITSLHFNAQGSDVYTILPSLREMCGGLRSLALSTSFCDGLVDSDHPTLNFEKLEELHLFMGGWSSISWSMPRLRRAWLRDYRSAQSALRLAFLKSYGGTLTFLSLYGAYRGLEIKEVLDSCPVLEHLAMEASRVPFDLALTQVLTHPTITTIDLFVSASDALSHPVHHVGMSTSGFPALRTVRLLDETMSCLSDIPSTLPAAHEGSLDPVAASDGPGLWIATVLSAPYPVSDAEDSDYDPQASEDCSDSDGTSSGSDSASAILASLRCSHWCHRMAFLQCAN